MNCAALTILIVFWAAKTCTQAGVLLVDALVGQFVEVGQLGRVAMTLIVVFIFWALQWYLVTRSETVSTTSSAPDEAQTEQGMDSSGGGALSDALLTKSMQLHHGNGALEELDDKTVCVEACVYLLASDKPSVNEPINNVVRKLSHLCLCLCFCVLLVYLSVCACACVCPCMLLCARMCVLFCACPEWQCL
jgi:hypothetical protein